MSQNWQKNTCNGVSFSIKLYGKAVTLLKRTPVQVLLACNFIKKEPPKFLRTQFVHLQKTASKLCLKFLKFLK